MIAAILNSGFEGTPISYSPRTDDVIALTLLACVDGYCVLQLFS